MPKPHKEKRPGRQTGAFPESQTRIDHKHDNPIPQHLTKAIARTAKAAGRLNAQPGAFVTLTVSFVANDGEMMTLVFGDAALLEACGRPPVRSSVSRFADEVQA